MKLARIAVIAAVSAPMVVVVACGSSGNSAACAAFYKAIGNTGVSENAYINNVQAAASQASGQTYTDMTTVVDDIVTEGTPVPSDMVAVGKDCNGG
jgi:hypothetical protein